MIKRLRFLFLLLATPALVFASEFPERDALRAQLAEELQLKFVKKIPASRKIGLLAVDFQRSFTDPDETLYVPGSETDIAAVDAFARANLGRISRAWATYDTHPVYYVGSKLYLKDVNGNPPPFFVDIDPQLVLDGVYVASNPNHQDRAIEYATCLKEKGLSWNVFPDHGIQGSEGWALHPTLEALWKDFVGYWHEGSERAPDPMMVLKALNPHVEAFGAVSAICQNEDPHTHMQELWVQDLQEHVANGGVIIGFGEALNFCVSGTLIPLVTEAGIPADRIILAYDASSPIPAFEQRTRDVLQQAKDLGIRFAYLSNLKVNGMWRNTTPGQPELNYTLPTEPVQ